MDEAFGELDKIIAARVEPTRLTRVLHGRQDQPRESADDRDDDQHLDEGESAAAVNTTCFDGMPLDKMAMNALLDERQLAHARAV